MDVAEVFRALSAYGPAGALLVVVFVGAWERREDRRQRADEAEKRLQAATARAEADKEIARALTGLTSAVGILQSGLPTVCRAHFGTAPPGMRAAGHG